jgi:Zn-finger nucleic acid-binding protein
MQACDGCGGEFIGGEELARIVRNKRESFSEPLHEALANRKPDFGHVGSQPQRNLECPACGHTMSLVNYAGDSGIFVDTCPMCSGLWLEHEELEKIQVIMERWADESQPQIQALAGQLEQARRRAAERAGRGFRGSRFAFVNAIINKLLDAA